LTVKLVSNVLNVTDSELSDSANLPPSAAILTPSEVLRVPLLPRKKRLVHTSPDASNFSVTRVGSEWFPIPKYVGKGTLKALVSRSSTS
jgi:hypothetical protein